MKWDSSTLYHALFIAKLYTCNHQAGRSLKHNRIW